jgi:hemerythrin-like domain-containing protein
MSITLAQLRIDHQNFARIFNVIEHQIQAAKFGRPVAVLLLRMSLTYLREYPHRIHHPKEDLIYSALALRAPNEAAAAAFHALEDHRMLFDRLEPFEHAIRALDEESVEGLDIFRHEAQAFVEKQRHHMELEEAQLFPLAETLLHPSDWNVIERFMANGRDPMFGSAISGPYDRLRSSIEDIDGILDNLPPP